MEHGIALPTTVAGNPGRALVGWATRAEECGFATLGVLDRVVYGNHEPVVALAAAAAVTRRIRLATTILLAACRTDVTLLAKQLATVDQIAGGRLVLGVAAGARADDFDRSGVPFARRGRRLDEVLRRLPEVWSGVTGVGPAPVAPPPILVGGHSSAAQRRAARYGQGWIMGGGSGTPAATLVAQVRAAWAEAGRTAGPRIVALAYFALGAGAADRAGAHLRAYYAGTGPYAQRVVSAAVTNRDGVRSAVDRFADAGVDEIVFVPCAAEIDQVDRLAAVVAAG